MTQDDEPRLLDDLDEGRRRVAEQRAIAERLLEEARALEQRLDEAGLRARAAAEQRLREACEREEEERRNVEAAQRALAERRREREAAEAAAGATRNGVHPETAAADLRTPEMTQRVQAAMATLLPETRSTLRVTPAMLAAAGVIVVVIAVVLALLVFRPAPKIGVCASGATTRLASDIIGAWSGGGQRVTLVDAAGDGRCDLRFGIAAQAAPNRVIARDALVAIVNPVNSASRIASRTLRAIVGGSITTWTQPNAPRGTIAVVLPDERSDEGRILAETLLEGVTPSAQVRHVEAGQAVTQAVASASGRTAIGIVAFSAAAPARVLALDTAPPPSTLAIATRTYPLSVVVTADLTSGADARTADLWEFVHSPAVQSIAVRDGFVSRSGT